MDALQQAAAEEQAAHAAEHNRQLRRQLQARVAPAPLGQQDLSSCKTQNGPGDYKGPCCMCLFGICMHGVESCSLAALCCQGVALLSAVRDEELRRPDMVDPAR